MRQVVFQGLKLPFYLQCQGEYGVYLGMVNNNVYCGGAGRSGCGVWCDGGWHLSHCVGRKWAVHLILIIALWWMVYQFGKTAETKLRYLSVLYMFIHVNTLLTYTASSRTPRTPLTCNHHSLLGTGPSESTSFPAVPQAMIGFGLFSHCSTQNVNWDVV